MTKNGGLLPEEAESPFNGRMKSATTFFRWRLCAIVTGVLLALLTAEFGWRLHVYGWAGFSLKAMNSLWLIGGRAMVQPSKTPGLRYEFKPDLELQFMGQPFQTNAFGMRDQPRATARIDGVLRVALVGDSFTMGFALPAEATFGRLLETMLSARLGQAVEVLNFAVSGYSLLDYAAVVEHRLAEFKPDLVLVGLCFNDFQMELLPNVRLNKSTRTPGFFRSHLVDEYRAIRLANRRSIAPDSLLSLGAAPWVGTSYQDSSRPYPTYWMARIKDLAGKLKMPVLFVYLNFDRTDQSLLGQFVFGAIATSLSIEYVDLTPAFDDFEPAELFVLPDDSHPNAEANQIFAAELVEPIAKRLQSAR
jgi:lysophospholipase L1-like esterase